MIKLITLDLDNTLWDIDPVIIRAEKKMRAWITDHVPEAVSYMEMDYIKGTFKRVLKNHPELSHHPTNFRKKILYHTFLDANLSNNDAQLRSEEAFYIFYKERNQISLFHQAESALEKISQQFPIIALSNGNADLAMIGIKHLFKAHFSAESEGKPKPHSNMFLKALDFANVSPQETIHIGDHAEEDIQAADALGFKTIWFNQDGKQPDHLCHPTLTITQIGMLPDAIERIKLALGHSSTTKKTPV